MNAMKRIGRFLIDIMALILLFIIIAFIGGMVSMGVNLIG